MLHQRLKLLTLFQLLLILPILGYAICPQGSEQRDSNCLACAVGMVSAEGIKCTPCANDQITDVNRTECRTCPADQKPDSNRVNCLCPNNHTMGNDGKCQPCPNGTISSNGSPCFDTNPAHTRKLTIDNKKIQDDADMIKQTDEKERKRIEDEQKKKDEDNANKEIKQMLHRQSQTQTRLRNEQQQREQAEEQRRRQADDQKRRQEQDQKRRQDEELKRRQMEDQRRKQNEEQQRRQVEDELRRNQPTNTTYPIR